MTFDEMVRTAAGVEPYPYQRLLADDGLPELLRVPTGAGKTMAAVLPWLYRRRFHPDGSVRATTPRWLVFTLPMRVLVEQVSSEVEAWVKSLGISSDELGVYQVMGGELAEDREWRTYPERDAVFVGTLDMLVSRALNRGYGESRWSWPIDFGLFNNGTQWVFDEVQLMGPALPTTRQMQSFREQLGSALPTSSMWMSATVPDGELGTIDRPTVATSVELGEVDRTGRLAKRLEAKKRVRQLAVDHNKYDSSFAEAVAAVHRPACRTLAFVNTVERAHALAALLRRSTPDEVNVVLVHSRFRPVDRAVSLRQALAEPVGVGGTIVVTTQVLEAGVDVSSTTLVTEVAPWSSLVQRFGRCNRAGLETDAEIWWVVPPKPAPYDEMALTASASVLAGLENVEVDAGSVGALSVHEPTVIHHVLRRRDLLELFDTTPDLSGNDVDVARFIRDGDDLDLSVAWWELEGAPSAERGLPGRDERCPVPVGEVRSFLAKRGEGAWRYDHVAQRWVKARPSDLRPGMVVVIDAAAGGYEPHVGWSAKSKGAVPVVETTAAADDLSDQDLAVDADPVSFMGRWVGLSAHLAGVEAAFVRLDSALSPSGLAPQQRDAARRAARLHDVGKVHPAFQERLDSTEGGMESTDVLGVGPPWAKSAAGRGGRGGRRYFRHELASALALLGEGRVALEGCEEPDLAVYLVAAHHGRVRLGIRGFPDEVDPDGEGRRVALGVADGEVLPAVEIPGGSLPPTTLSLAFAEVGDLSDGQASWGARALTLRDRPDLGPFRLGYLEAMVRLADWRRSREEQSHE